MYILLRSITTRSTFVEQLAVVMTSLVIAELFYKFHSFSLECVAFLATWYVLDLTVNRVRALIAQMK